MPSSSLVANIGGRPGPGLPVSAAGGLADSHATSGEEFEYLFGLMNGGGDAAAMDGDEFPEADLDPDDEAAGDEEAVPQVVPDGVDENSPPVMSIPFSADSTMRGAASSVLFQAPSSTRSDVRTATGTAGPMAEEIATMQASAASPATVSGAPAIHPDILSAATSGASPSPTPLGDGAVMPVLSQNAAIPPGPAIPTRLPEAATPPSRQVAELVLRMDADRAEITLFPEELGTVRIALSREGDRLVVRLWAERAETLDLLRRHSVDLAQDLALAGHEDALVDLGPSRGGAELGLSARKGRDADPPEEEQRDEVFPHEGARRQQVMLPGRVDLRL